MLNDYHIDILEMGDDYEESLIGVTLQFNSRNVNFVLTVEEANNLAKALRATTNTIEQSV